jgi:flagellar biosynthesis/type III secretory pathway protein FliH
MEVFHIGGIIMRSFNFKKIVGISALGLVAVLGMSESASAQGGWRNDQRQERKIDKQQEKIQKQRAKLEQQRVKLQNKRYRVNRNGSYYNTDQRGAEMLRQAVNAGYQQGYRAGQQDRNGRRNSSWNNSSVYRSGTYGYQNHVNRSQYQYYFQQGFQKGYQDGYNSQYRYGSNNGGSLNILSTILNQVLNIQQY